jgi:hypothetical protein
MTFNKMQYFNLNVNFIAKNEDGNKITIAWFELQTFIDNGTSFKTMQYSH